MIQIPEKAAYIIRTLEENGYEAYAVGGCIRDSIMGRTPQDWDITTSALPGSVKELFRRTVDTGIQHGTVTIMLGEEGFEVTTYRIDGEYEDSRHPKKVEFTRSLAEDLRRRDFTINAMAYSPAAGLVDLFGGLEDINRKVLRCVGEPEERFGEDALRMLRAVRFSGQLGFVIEPGTKEAIGVLASTLQNISAERIREEMTKLLISPSPEQLEAAVETGMTRIILPEADESGADGRENCYRGLAWIRSHFTGSEADRVILSYSMLLLDGAKAKKVLKRLKFDNRTIRLGSLLCERKGTIYREEKPAMRRLLGELGAENMELLLFFQEALAHCMPESDEAVLANVFLGRKLMNEIQEAGDCVSLKELAVKGADLIACGIQPGKELGAALSRLLDLVLEDPGRNTKEQLLAAMKTEE